MNNLDIQYQNLLNEILTNGVVKKDRTGTGTKSIFGYTIRHNMADGFPLLTTKKMYYTGIISELIWFLRGDTNIKWLIKNKCTIWVGDAYKTYTTRMSTNDSKWNKWMRDNGDGTVSMYTRTEFIEKIMTDEVFANAWGELGPSYGKQWRGWEGKPRYENYVNLFGYTDQRELPAVDQIANLIHDLRTNPDSRRLLVSAWNVTEIDQVVLPPCHYAFQVYTRELTSSERADIMDKKIGTTKEDRVLPYLTKDLEYHNIPTRAISLIWNQRSVDTFLGLPFNIASYGLLLCLLAKEVNMVPDQLIGNLGDTHLYLNHLDQAREQLSRVPYELPTLELINYSSLDDLIEYPYYMNNIYIRDYKSHPKLGGDLSN